MLLFFFSFVVKEGLAIRNAELLIPPLIRADSSATLLCLYDLEGASLYSVMWFRGQHEFFRYIPSEMPSGKVFNVAGFYVDVYTSNQHQVTLHNIPTFVSGEISCEITTEAGPSFSTACVSGFLNVQRLDIALKLSKTSYQPGDHLIALCLVTGMEANITFHLNSFKVPREFVTQPSLNTAILNLTLTREHFLPKKHLQLQCSGVLEGNFQIFSKVMTVKYDLDEKISENSASFLKQPMTFLFLILINTL